jgi:hypothetical protein
MATVRPDPYPDDSYVFGPIIGPHDVDECLYDILHLWQVSYLREVARRAGEDPDELVPFRSWRVSHEMEAMPEDQKPTLIIMNGGLEDQPLKRGTLRPGKSFYACYKYRIGCLASAKGKKVKAAPRANKLAKMYATAVRSILIQKRDDRGVLGMIDWVDDLPGPLDSDDDRTIAMWVVEFNVEVPNSAAWATGPTVPDDLPDGAPDPPLLGTVATVDVTIDKEGLIGDYPDYVPTPEPPTPYEYRTAHAYAFGQFNVPNCPILQNGREFTEFPGGEPFGAWIAISSGLSFDAAPGAQVTIDSLSSGAQGYYILYQDTGSPGNGNSEFDGHQSHLQGTFVLTMPSTGRMTIECGDGVTSIKVSY